MLVPVQGTYTPLVRAHAGRTQTVAADLAPGIECSVSESKNETACEFCEFSVQRCQTAEPDVSCNKTK